MKLAPLLSVSNHIKTPQQTRKADNVVVSNDSRPLNLDQHLIVFGLRHRDIPHHALFRSPGLLDLSWLSSIRLDLEGVLARSRG